MEHPTRLDGLARYEHLFARVFNTPLLITEEKLSVVASVLASHIGIDIEIPPAAARAAPSASRPTFAEAERRNGTAVIPVTGTFVHRAFAVGTPPSGMTSYADVQRAFDEALADPSVEKILLDVDSHGGEVNGVFDLSDHIFRARGQKPIYAAVDESAFSAAYAIASAADKVIVPRAGGVGSIGVMALHLDQSKLNERLGVKVTPVYAGRRKNDLSPHEPLSAEARASLEARINEVYDLFAKTVSRNRGLTEQQVRSTEAGRFFGEGAVKGGLADEVGPISELVSLLAAAGGSAGRVIVMSAATDPKQTKPAAADPKEAKAGADGTAAAQPAEPGKPKAEVIDLEEARKRHLEEGRVSGEKAERERVKALTELSMLAKSPELLAGMIESGASVDDARKQLTAALAARSPEIFNHVSPFQGGALSPVVADAQRRAEDVKKRRERLA